MKTLFSEDSKVKIVDHISLSNYTDVKNQHDEWVKQGFEGLCARNPEKEYGVNKRSSLYLIKLKMYSDAEFEIVGVQEGLRDEDMCFLMKTKDGKQFAAKPVGTAEQRRYYLAHPDEYIGKMGTCKYFTMSGRAISSSSEYAVDITPFSS